MAANVFLLLLDVSGALQLYFALSLTYVGAVQVWWGFLDVVLFCF